MTDQTMTRQRLREQAAQERAARHEAARAEMNEVLAQLFKWAEDAGWKPRWPNPDQPGNRFRCYVHGLGGEGFSEYVSAFVTPVGDGYSATYGLRVEASEKPDGLAKQATYSKGAVVAKAFARMREMRKEMQSVADSRVRRGQSASNDRAKFRETFGGEDSEDFTATFGNVKVSGERTSRWNHQTPDHRVTLRGLTPEQWRAVRAVLEAGE